MTPAEARKLRESLGLSQRAVARALEVHPPTGPQRPVVSYETLSRYETGAQPMPQWYCDVLVYLKRQGGFFPGERIVVTFPAVITRQHKSDGGKIEW